MKLFLSFLAGAVALTVAGAHAEEVADPPTANGSLSRVVRSDEQLDQLLGPIALYPDALIALILPASTDITDVVLAARYLRMENDSTQLDKQTWDDSVKALAHYPEVVKWMDDNLEWTKQLGEAFGAQAADVMRAVQRLRERARTVGTLTDSAQQRVVDANGAIAIEPAQPDVIYVPRYDPELVYWDRNYDYGAPLISFGVGLPAGAWLDYDCDWRTRSIWVGRSYQPNRWHPVYTGRPNRSIEAHVWQPNSHYYHTSPANLWAVRSEIFHPHPSAGAPTAASPARGTYPNRPVNSGIINNAWSREHREGLLRDTDAREVRHSNPPSPPAAALPAETPRTPTPVPPGTARVQGFHNDHYRENRGPAGAGAVSPAPSRPIAPPISGAIPMPRSEYRRPASAPVPSAPGVPSTPAVHVAPPAPRPPPAALPAPAAAAPAASVPATPVPAAAPRGNDGPRRGGGDEGRGGRGGR